MGKYTFDHIQGNIVHIRLSNNSDDDVDTFDNVSNILTQLYREGYSNEEIYYSKELILQLLS